MATRSRRRGEVAVAQAEMRLEAIRACRRYQRGSRERAEEIACQAERIGVKRSRMYDLVKQYEERGEKAAMRQRRKDADQARAGEALRQKWATFVCEGSRDAQRTTELAVAFYADWCEPRGLRLPTLATLRRWRAEVDPRHRMTAREAKRASTTKSRVRARYANHCWIADQATADLHIRVPDKVDKQTGEILTWRLQRPFFFHFVDVFSGAEMGGGYYLAYNTATVEHALLDSIYPDADGDLPLCGTPELIWWDHGVQHWSDWAREALRVLGIKAIGAKSAPGEPTHHGLIEGSHSHTHAGFESALPGYCGGDNKKERRPLALRLADDGEAPEPDYLTLEELNQRWRAYRAELMRRPYRRHGSEDQACRLTRWLRGLTDPERRAVPDRTELAWRWMPREDRWTTAEGHILFRHRRYAHPRLADYHNRKVEVRYIDGSAEALWVVLRGTEDLFCVATPLADVFIGDDVTHETVKRAHKRGREVVRDLRRYREAAGRLAAGGLISEAAAEAVETGLSEVEAAVKPGRTVQVDVDQVLAEPAAEVLELHPKAGRKRLDKRDDEVVTEVLAGLTGEPPAVPAGGGDYGIWG